MPNRAGPIAFTHTIVLRHRWSLPCAHAKRAHRRWLACLKFDQAVHHIVLEDCIAAVEAATARRDRLEAHIEAVLPTDAGTFAAPARQNRRAAAPPAPSTSNRNPNLSQWPPQSGRATTCPHNRMWNDFRGRGATMGGYECGLEQAWPSVLQNTQGSFYIKTVL